MTATTPLGGEMFSALGLSFIYLTGGGTIEGPVHSYQYEYTAEYGVRAVADGTHFYTRENSTLELEFLIGLGTDVLLTANIDSGIDTPKFNAAPSLSLKIEKIISISASQKLTLYADFSFLGNQENIPCVDSTGKTFHCYHGVVPADPYYLLSFDEIDDIYKNKINPIRGIGFRYDIIF